MNFLTEIKGLDILVGLLIKSTLILALSFSLLFLFRKKSATFKHFLLSLSLISLLLLPLFSTLTKGWETRLLPSLTKQQQVSLPALSSTEVEKSFAQPDFMIPIEDQTPLPLSTRDTDTANVTAPLRSALAKKIAKPAFLAIWTVGLLFLLTKILIGLYGAFKLTRQGKAVTDRTWKQLLIFFLQAVSIKRKICLLSHKRVLVPLTWGVFKPVVIVPDEAKKWSRDECSSALFHELSHIKRSDFLVKILSRLSCALYWFNPLCWFAFRMMKKEQEKACDELVLKAGVKPSTYATNLLSIKKAGRTRWHQPSTALGAVGKSQLNERLLAILKQPLCPQEVKMKTKILLSTFVIFSIVLIGLARPAPSSAQCEKGLIHEEKIAAFSQPAPLIQNATTQEEKQEITKKAENEKQEQNKEQEEKADQKTEEKKTITWVTKDGKTVTIHIVPGDKDETGEVKVLGDMVIHIDKDTDEKTYIIQLPDERIKLLKNDEGEWTILKADETELEHGQTIKALKLDKALDLQNKTAYSIKLEKGKGGKSYVVVTKPHLELKKMGKMDIYLTAPDLKFEFHPDLKGFTFRDGKFYTNFTLAKDSQEIDEKLEKIREKLKQIREEKEIGQEERDEILEEIQKMLDELGEKLRKKKEELKDVKLGVYTDAKLLEDAKLRVLTDAKLLKELKDIEVGIHSDLEELEELKDSALRVHAGSIDLDDLKDVVVSIHSDKLELKDLKDIVKDIAIGVHAGSAELKDLKDVIVSVHPEDAKAEVLSGVVVKVDPDVEDIHIGDIHVSDTIKGKHTVIDIGVDNKVFAVVDKGEKEFQIFIKADFDKDTRAQYEKAVKEIKEKLPETYKVESEIDEDKGTVTIKITGGADKKDTKISLDKLMKDIKEVIAHIKGVLTIDIE